MAPSPVFVFFLFLVTGGFFPHDLLSEGYEILYQTPAQCLETQYFEYSSMKCEDCGANTKQSADGLSCVCLPQHKWAINYGGPETSCTKCDGNKVATLDGWDCVTCGNGVGTNGNCKSCDAGNVAVEREINGELMSNRSCYTCEDNSVPLAEAQRCIYGGSTTTLANTTSCDNRLNLNAGNKLSPLRWETDYFLYYIAYYDIGDEILQVESIYFKDELRKMQESCMNYCNFTSCQHLGNMCVMNMYYSGLNERLRTDTCREYLSLVEKSDAYGPNSIRDWPSFMPWLYYYEVDTRDDATDVLTNNDIKTQFSANQVIKFVIAKYSADGVFLGLHNDISEIQMCLDKQTKMDAAYKFATSYKISCSLSLMDLWQRTSTTFYDLFILVNNDKYLYPVPVLVDNYRDKNGQYPNQKTDRTEWVLTRRFFLVDNLSGKTKVNSPAEYMRYAESIKLEISLRSTQGEIYPPLLRVKYVERKVTTATVKASTVVPVSFQVAYEMDVTDITKDSEIAIGVLTGVALLYAFLKVYGWRRRKGLLICDFGTIVKFVAFSFGSISSLYFWILFGISTQWLIFFKEQDQVYRLLPTDSQKKFFVDILIIAFVFKLFDLVHLFINQLSIDIFFVDWERPRGTIMQPGQGGDSKGTLAPVSIWRTFFVANEWNEIQTMRKINPNFQLFAVLFFLKIAGFEHLTTTDPFSRFSVNIETDYIGEYDPVLRFSVLTIVYLSIACVQWIFFAFIYERFVGDVLGDFVDLCSMANVSIFIMPNTLFGYYIHGRSVHGRADTDMMDMNIQLKREEEDLCGKRGLEPNSEKQTFEMLLPTSFREQYDRYYEPLQSRDTQMQRRNAPPGGGGEFRLSPGVERSIQAYFTLNKYLSAFIDHSLREVDYIIKDKMLLERVVDMELNDPPANKAVFYNDDGRSFNNVLFYGNEMTLLLFDILFFAIVDLIATDYLLAAVLTYFMNRLLVVVRDSFGRRNLAAKTLVDERFLI